MRTVAVTTFIIGLLLAVRVMFFGVRRAVAEKVRMRAGEFAVAAVLVVAGAGLYVVIWSGSELTLTRAALVFIPGGVAGLVAWWLVRTSAAAAAATPDPDEDPRYRFQGHVARVVSAIRDGAGSPGAIAFDFDGRHIELAAVWLTTGMGGMGGMAGMASAAGAVDSEVVIERVDGDVAYVEPWSLVENRL